MVIFEIPICCHIRSFNERKRGTVCLKERTELRVPFLSIARSPREKDLWKIREPNLCFFLGLDGSMSMLFALTLLLSGVTEPPLVVLPAIPIPWFSAWTGVMPMSIELEMPTVTTTSSGCVPVEECWSFMLLD